MPNWFKKILSGPSQLPTVHSNLFPNDRQEFYDDPYPYYEALRKDHPFYRVPDGAWVLSRHADIKAALNHPSLGNRPSRFSTLNSSKSDRYVCANLANNIMPFLDGIPHKEQRRQVARIFQKEVKAFTPRLDDLATTAVTELGSEFQVIADFAHPFAIQMICGILGIPIDPRLRQWSSSFFHLFTKIPTVEIRSEVDLHLTEFRDWIRSCFLAPNPTGILAALQDLITSQQISEAVAIDTLILLFADGLENVDSGIGNALFSFSKHPEQWHKLRQDPALVESAVAEILRFESPAQYIARTCLEDFEWQGHSFKKDLTVILLLASANRDEEAFPNADHFDISRPSCSHLSFGHGKHSCLGAKLVELELAAILTALSHKFTAIELIGELSWQTRTGHRWMQEATFRGHS